MRSCAAGTSVLEPRAIRFYPSPGGAPDTTLASQLLGFVNADGDAQGRPVGVVADKTGALLVVADFAAREGLWFHVDGAYGAMAAASAALRPLFTGMNRADSIAADPHKWLYVPYEAGATLVREGEDPRPAVRRHLERIDEQLRQQPNESPDACAGLVLGQRDVADLDVGVVALDAEATVETVADGMAAHPTLSEAIMEAARETESPVIVQASRGARSYSQDNYLRHLMLAAAELYPDIPVAMHQDHGNSPATCKSAIENGFTSVMMDGSLKEDGKTPADFDYNVRVTREVAERPARAAVTV